MYNVFYVINRCRVFELCRFFILRIYLAGYIKKYTYIYIYIYIYLIDWITTLGRRWAPMDLLPKSSFDSLTDTLRSSLDRCKRRKRTIIREDASESSLCARNSRFVLAIDRTDYNGARVTTRSLKSDFFRNENFSHMSVLLLREILKIGRTLLVTDFHSFRVL